MLKLTLLDNTQEVQKKVTKALAVELNKRLASSVNKLRERIKPIIETALLSSPEIRSLSGGTLAAEFGLDSDPTSSIVRAIVDSVEVKSRRLALRI